MDVCRPLISEAEASSDLFPVVQSPGCHGASPLGGRDGTPLGGRGLETLLLLPKIVLCWAAVFEKPCERGYSKPSNFRLVTLKMDDYI